MISSPDLRAAQGALRHPGRTALITALVSVAVLVGCTAKPGGTAATQTAAKVNRSEVTVQQIDFVLQQLRGIKPEQTEAVGKQILERLINQELALQKAEELQLDRDPRVVRLLEVARREILTRAYVEKSGLAVAKPSADDVKQYYDAHPALFSARRIYTLQELAIEARPEQVATLREQLGAVKTVNDFVEYLKANNYRYVASQAVRSAEQLPLKMLDAVAKLNDGQAMLVPTGIGAQVIVLAGSRPEPVDEARAQPAIEQFLLNEAKRKQVDTDIKALRAAAKIEYVGTYANAAASAPAATPALPAIAASAPEGLPGTLDPQSIGKDMGLK
jgi:EpsD family peptidyl-prolyl cis-trans isomerase